MWLTDEEQKKLLEEMQEKLKTTTGKVRAMFAEYLGPIPPDVVQKRIEKELEEIKAAVNRGNGGKLWAWAKGVLTHAASTANKIRIDE